MADPESYTAKIQTDAARTEVIIYRAALQWYGEQARLARLVHSGGDPGRHALAEDGGRRARDVLAGGKALADADPIVDDLRAQLAEMKRRADDAKAALRLALPVMRHRAHNYFECFAIRRAPDRIAPIEWDEAADLIHAIRAATACVGPQPDMEGVNTEWLDAVLAEAPK